MQYGFYLPTRGPLANRRDLSAILQTAERLGFASVMVADHIVLPTQINSPYPYTVKGNFVSEGECFEQLAMMAFVAGRTEKMRIVSSVMIVPHRNPVFNAKALATIDVLSGGRVTVGIGVGWMEEEFKALAAADFKHRGAVTDEYIAIFKKLWTGEPATHKGKSTASTKCCASPSRSRTRDRRSGLAATPTRRCGASRGSATAGIRLAPRLRHPCRRRKCARSSIRSGA